jgi:hypothetical protein
LSVGSHGEPVPPQFAVARGQRIESVGRHLEIANETQPVLAVDDSLGVHLDLLG